MKPNNGSIARLLSLTIVTEYDYNIFYLKSWFEKILNCSYWLLTPPVTTELGAIFAVLYFLPFPIKGSFTFSYLKFKKSVVGCSSTTIP